LGAFPIATIGSGSKKEFLRTRYGLREGQVLVRETDRKKFAQQLKGALSEKRRLESEEDGDGGKEEGEVEGFDLILDALGGLYFKEGYKHLARGGRMITFGAADYLSTKDSADWFKIIPRYVSPLASLLPALPPYFLCDGPTKRGPLFPSLPPPPSPSHHYHPMHFPKISDAAELRSRRHVRRE